MPGRFARCCVSFRPVLLDQKRTKRIVRIAAILTSVAFAGVGVIVIALVIFGGTPTASQQLVNEAKAEGWDPTTWRDVAHAIAETTKWRAPLIPAAGDPSPFAGSPAIA